MPINTSLFPAPAGVILIDSIPLPNRITFPRTCGGDPALPSVCTDSANFSPHLRG